MTYTQPSFTAVRKALAAFLTAQTGLRATANQQARVSPPMAVVLPMTGPVITYSVDMTGSANLTLRAMLIMSQADSASGMDLMDDYLATTGPKSLWAAVQHDPTLGGVVEWAVVRQATGYGVINHGGIDYLGCSVIVDIGI